MIVHNQSTHVCHIPRLRLRLMQHNSLIIWLVTVTGDWGVHVGSNIGMFTFWHEHNTSNQNPSNSKTDKFWLQCKDFPMDILLYNVPPFSDIWNLASNSSVTKISTSIFRSGPYHPLGPWRLDFERYNDKASIRHWMVWSWKPTRSASISNLPRIRGFFEVAILRMFLFYAKSMLCFSVFFLVGKKAEGTVVPFLLIGDTYGKEMLKPSKSERIRST